MKYHRWHSALPSYKLHTPKYNQPHTLQLVMGGWKHGPTTQCIQPYSIVCMIYVCKQLHFFTNLLDSNYNLYNLYPKCNMTVFCCQQCTVTWSTANVMVFLQYYWFHNSPVLIQVIHYSIIISCCDLNVH